MKLKGFVEYLAFLETLLDASEQLDYIDTEEAKRQGESLGVSRK